MKYQITKSRDKIMNGIIAGLAGGTVQTVYAIIMKALHFTNREFIDYGEILVMGKDFPGTATIVGVVAHLVNAAAWGALFSIILTLGRPRYFVIKGIGLGIFVWLFSLAIATMFKLPMFHLVPPGVAYILLAGAILWGAVMSFTYKKLQ